MAANPKRKGFKNMSVLDTGQPRPDSNNPSEDDRSNNRIRPHRGKEKPNEFYAKYGKDHYEKNKKYYVDKAAEYKKKNKEAWNLYKSTLQCAICGINHPPNLLEFHHIIREGKKEKVYKLIGHGRFKAALEEIKKCIVLCSNHHREWHWLEDNGTDEDKARLLKIAKDCGF